MGVVYEHIITSSAFGLWRNMSLLNIYPLRGDAAGK